MARMFNPPHPGLTLHDDVQPALGLGVTEAAEQLGVSRVALSRMLNGRAAISPDMALRIEAWLGVERGGDARIWLAEQSAYDVWQASSSGFPRAIIDQQQTRATMPLHCLPHLPRVRNQCLKR
ncbi:MAG: HigA family addiction module antitoxin [Pseudomonadota bacterium]